LNNEKTEMRFRLTLHNPTSATAITWNYNYLLMAWIYERLKLADESYANFLHQEGYTSDQNQKRFKYFTFSPFHFNPGKNEYRFNRDGMVIKGESFYLDLSFYIDKAAEKFIVGVFRDQKLKIFNDRQRAEFQIGQIATLPEPEFSPSMIFKAWAPMNIAQKQEGKQDQYLRPDETAFGDLLALNLADKYQNATGETISPNEIKYELLTDPEKISSRKISIKEQSKAETQIKGYHDFEFKLTAPTEVIRCGYYSGFGRFNGQGMGMVEINNL
jgi:CRISPR-associated endoribonuclease Cas6